MEVNQLVSTYNTANPFEIADYLGIEYDFKTLPNNLKGILVSSEKDTPLILINEDIQDISFKYYVMAHELKHAIDHADLIGYYSLCYGGKGKLELEANKFATELMLLLYQEQYQDIPETFDKLISTYGVKEEMREYY